MGLPFSGHVERFWVPFKVRDGATVFVLLDVEELVLRSCWSRPRSTVYKPQHTLNYNIVTYSPETLQHVFHSPSLPLSFIFFFSFPFLSTFHSLFQLLRRSHKHDSRTDVTTTNEHGKKTRKTKTEN